MKTFQILVKNSAKVAVDLESATSSEEIKSLRSQGFIIDDSLYNAENAVAALSQYEENMAAKNKGSTKFTVGILAVVLLVIVATVASKVQVDNAKLEQQLAKDKHFTQLCNKVLDRYAKHQADTSQATYTFKRDADGIDMIVIDKAKFQNGFGAWTNYYNIECHVYEALDEVEIYSIKE